MSETIYSVYQKSGPIIQFRPSEQSIISITLNVLLGGHFILNRFYSFDA